MALADRILSLLRTDSGLTDRQLADTLLGEEAPQQAVNQVCRSLANRGLIQRKLGADGRIENFLTTALVSEPHAPETGSLPEPPGKIPHWATEDALKAVLKHYLEEQEWSVSVAWGSSHGSDIDASHEQERWIIEIKGHGSRPQMRVNYFLAILGETLQRMTDPAARYSIALPDVAQFRVLWANLPSLAKQRTGISALFIDEHGTVTEHH